jgi:fatty-acyl-CoA synthase
MLYSSGTTGRPKGIRPKAAHLPLEESPIIITPVLRDVLGFGPGDVYLSPAPLYHAAPLRFCMGVHQLGGTVVVMERFDPAALLDLVAAHRVTHAQLVPTMFVRLLRLPAEVRAAADVSSLRAVVHAAAPCPPEVKRQMLDWWGPIVHEYYSATEGSGLTWVTSEEWLAHPGTVGRPVIGVPHIVGSGGQELGPGRRGASSSRTGRSSSTTRTPSAPSRCTTSAGGRRSATSATSTRTATCSSPTAPPTRSSRAG